MEMLAKAICKWCGKEFEQRSGVGSRCKYCSPKCRNARNNRKFRDNKVKELGIDYWAWRLCNDAAFKEKRKEYYHEYNRSLTERRREKEKEKE